MNKEVSYEHLEAEIESWKYRRNMERGIDFQWDMKNDMMVQYLEEMLFEKVLFEDEEIV